MKPNSVLNTIVSATARYMRSARRRCSLKIDSSTVGGGCQYATAQQHMGNRFAKPGSAVWVSAMQSRHSGDERHLVGSLGQENGYRSLPRCRHERA